MNNEQQQIINEVYEDYCKGYWNLGFLQDKIVYGSSCYNHNTDDYTFEELSKEQFIDKCKTNLEFSEKWGLRIEERELSLEEKCDWLNKNYPMYGLSDWTIKEISDVDYFKEVEFEYEVPTKLITLTYNNKTIESYE